MIHSLSVDGQAVRMRLATGSVANLKPEAVIRAYMDQAGLVLVDFALLVQREEVYGSRGTGEGAELVALDAFGEEIG